MLKAFLWPFVKRVHIQPTLGDKPFGKGFTWLIVKLGFKIIGIEYRPRFKIHHLGDLFVSE